jgi:hypothetical protein
LTGVLGAAFSAGLAVVFAPAFPDILATEIAVDLAEIFGAGATLRMIFAGVLLGPDWAVVLQAFAGALADAGLAVVLAAALAETFVGAFADAAWTGDLATALLDGLEGVFVGALADAGLDVVLAATLVEGFVGAFPDTVWAGALGTALPDGLEGIFFAGALEYDFAGAALAAEIVGAAGLAAVFADVFTGATRRALLVSASSVSWASRPSERSGASAISLLRIGNRSGRMSSVERRSARAGFERYEDLDEATRGTRTKATKAGPTTEPRATTS